MIYLLDTDIIIYWMSGNENISQKVISIGFNNIAASDISRAELYYGAYKSQKITENILSIKNLSAQIAFLPFNDLAQDIFGATKAALEKKGARLDDLDLMIASTSIAYNLTLVTNNIKHMERIPNLKLENWV